MVRNLHSIERMSLLAAMLLAVHPSHGSEAPDRPRALRFPAYEAVPHLDAYASREACHRAVADRRLLKVFFGEGHTLSGRAQERDEEAVRWFQRLR